MRIGHSRDIHRLVEGRKLVLGGVENGKEIFSARLASDRNKTEDQYALDIKGILEIHRDIFELDNGFFVFLLRNKLFD